MHISKDQNLQVVEWKKTKQNKNQIIVVLMNKPGELSDTEGSIKSFAVHFEFCFTLGVTKRRKSVRPEV